MLTAEDYIKNLNLNPHPEGGYYRETYRSPLIVKRDSIGQQFTGARSCSTGIYFLLQKGQVSHFHRIKSDEMWHFYQGNPLEIIEVSEDGGLIKTVLGPSILEGQCLQYVVKAGHWFGAQILNPEKASFALVGCTVAPGFDFKDFELAQNNEIMKSQIPEDYHHMILNK